MIELQSNIQDSYLNRGINIKSRVELHEFDGVVQVEGGKYILFPYDNNTYRINNPDYIQFEKTYNCPGLDVKFICDRFSEFLSRFWKGKSGEKMYSFIHGENVINCPKTGIPVDVFFTNDSVSFRITFIDLKDHKSEWNRLNL